MDASIDVPQWKKELLLKRRLAAAQQHHQQPANHQQRSHSAMFVPSASCFGHPPPTTTTTTTALTSCGSSSSHAAFGTLTTSRHKRCSSSKQHQQQQLHHGRQCTCLTSNDDKMVQDTTKTTQLSSDSDSSSSEELQYGPGIVNKLKNRYLSLTLRESGVKVRPSILHMRKATSLENLLDEDEAKMMKQVQQHQHYHHHHHHAQQQQQRLFESRMNGTNGNAKNVPNRYRNATRGCGGDMKRARSVEAITTHTHATTLNLTPSPPQPPPQPPVSKQVRLNRPKRIQPILNEREKPPLDVVRQAKKIFEARPEFRTKLPVSTGEVAAKVASYKSIIIQTKQNKPPIIKQKPSSKKCNNTVWKAAPIPDVSMINNDEGELCEKKTSSLSETPDLILHSSPIHHPQQQASLEFLHAEIQQQQNDAPTIKLITAEHQRNISNASESITYNFNNKPLKLDISVVAGPVVLSPREIEKNLINATKSSGIVDVPKQQQQQQQPPTPAPSPVAVVAAAKRVTPPPPSVVGNKDEQNCVVFKFTDRKDVPDYIGNDGTVRALGKIQMPKVGEGGITLLPGASIDESLADYDDELLSLEGPPSPCDVDFVNDNILIDGRSSLNQKTKRNKMRIHFVEAVPIIFEYPSESSMLLNDVESPISPTPMGHTVPSLSGSSLANYTPKGSIDCFQLGVTKTNNVPPPAPNTNTTTHEESIQTITTAIKDEFHDEQHQPILFSSGTNTDILF